MSKPLWFRGKKVLMLKNKAKQIKIIAQKSNILFFAIALAIFAVIISLWNSQTTAYAHAATADTANMAKIASSLLENQSDLFPSVNEKIYSVDMVQAAPVINNGKSLPRNKEKTVVDDRSVEQPSSIDGGKALGIANSGLVIGKEDPKHENESHEFADKLYGIVGETPIKEMVPFISERDDKVAAFLVGMAKKESSFGLASPSKNGQTCYNYWGYKGEGERGTGMGYACFASAQEAIRVVGDRIETLVNKGRNTPARMVDTWKCGVSCAGDPGAPSWTATVALYFNQIVDQNS